MTIEAVLLVGGHGTRLRPLTVTTPKQLLPLAGVPQLAHVIARAGEAGVERVVLATSYKAELFAAAFGDGSRLGVEMAYVVESQPLGTGGGIRNAAAALRAGPSDPVVVLNGDVLSGHDLAAQLKVHAASGAEVTLYLTEVSDARAFGCVPTDPTGRVTAFLEKMPNPVTNQINAGCYVFRRRVIDRIPAGRPVSVERETFPQLLADGIPIQGYVDTAYWLDIGTPAAYVQASADLVTGALGSPVLPGEPGEALVLAGADVAADAVLSGGSVIGAGGRVGAGAVVDGSVLLDGAQLAAGTVARRSVVGRGGSVGAGAVLDEAVLGDDVRVGARNELRAGVRVWPGITLPDGAIRFSTDA